MMDKPILPHEIKKIYQGRVFSVVSERVTLPKGHQIDIEVVRHPGSVVIAPMIDNDRLMLVRQYRHAVGRAMWELAAGSLKPNEDPQQAAIRECHEEIGLVPTKVERLGSFFPTPGYCDEEMTFYKATELRQPKEGEKANPDEDEDIEVHAFALADLVRMIRTGEIADLKTVAGVFLIRS